MNKTAELNLVTLRATCDKYSYVRIHNANFSRITIVFISKRKHSNCNIQTGSFYRPQQLKNVINKCAILEHVPTV